MVRWNSLPDMPVMAGGPIPFERPPHEICWKLDRPSFAQTRLRIQALKKKRLPGSRFEVGLAHGALGFGQVALRDRTDVVEYPVPVKPHQCPYPVAFVDDGTVSEA